MKDDWWDKMNNKFFYFVLSKSRPIFDKVKYTDKFSMVKKQVVVVYLVVLDDPFVFGNILFDGRCRLSESLVVWFCQFVSWRL